MEEWRPIPGYEGLYEVSDLGRVKRIWRWDSPVNYCLHPGGNGKYLHVVLCKDAVKETVNVHILVAGAFLPNPDNLPHVLHKDDVGTNNRLTNLYRGTPEDNWIDRKANQDA